MKSENSPNADHGHIPEAILGATKVRKNCSLLFVASAVAWLKDISLC
ncbi:MAG: hypothetical protein WA421_13795 [Nitrososphaeraceae archaeon]